jgi:hypothetical protein
MKALTIFGGGILLAVGLIVVSQIAEQQRAAEIDFDRDICVSFRSEKLPAVDVTRKLTPSPRSEAAQQTWGKSEQEFWVALKNRIAIHNASATNANDDDEYVFGSGLSYQMNLNPYRGLAAGTICKANDLSICRNRNFWFFKRIPPPQLADIVFSNTVKKAIQIKACPFPRKG